MKFLSRDTTYCYPQAVAIPVVQWKKKSISATAESKERGFVPSRFRMFQFALRLPAPQPVPTAFLMNLQ